MAKVEMGVEQGILHLAPLAAIALRHRPATPLHQQPDQVIHGLQGHQVIEAHQGALAALRQ